MIPWVVAHQVPLSLGFSRQKDWNGLPFPSPGDLPDPGIEPSGEPSYNVGMLNPVPVLRRRFQYSTSENDVCCGYL